MTDLLPYFRGETSEAEAESLLAQAFADLHAALETRPDAEQGVLDILSHRLAEINTETWEVLTTGIDNYLGENLAYPTIWLQVWPSDERKFEKYASPKVVDFLCKIQGLHGPELQRAFDVWNWSPDDWKTVFREVLFDHINDRYRVRLRVLKYSGEQTIIECSPDDFLELTTHILRTLRLVPREGFLNPATLSAYFVEVVEVEAALTPAPEGADTPTKEPAAQAD